ncbi:hypothetical protein EYR41_001165 [Orbilia oligospora]|uniref:Uncharacterized protein n=1 Tax=Orbilia oligospora TaxID=2813651 RepID=A0A7C8PUK5_ORBOL|nr:hypothetical protein TWF751_011566 [Orbilia oligospora]TGJ74124.1 hypothetical protein EYR41_001165 [Orbilia oligospora]
MRPVEYHVKTCKKKYLNWNSYNVNGIIPSSSSSSSLLANILNHHHHHHQTKILPNPHFTSSTDPINPQARITTTTPTLTFTSKATIPKTYNISLYLNLAYACLTKKKRSRRTIRRIVKEEEENQKNSQKRDHTEYTRSSQTQIPRRRAW